MKSFLKRVHMPIGIFLSALIALGFLPGIAASTSTVETVDNVQAVERTSKQFEPQPIYNADGTIDIGPVVRNKDMALSIDTTSIQAPTIQQTGSYTVGDTRTFIALDTLNGFFTTDYEVRLISDTVEIWVQQDLTYTDADGKINPIHPDSRDPEYITDERIMALATATERVIPINVEFYGEYAGRDGSNAQLPTLVPDLNLPDDYYAGSGNSVIILVSNVRDDNFYDPINNSSFVAGFFSGQVNGFADRNIISIDSKQWNRRTGPPDFGYEATIAHEFQHLIHNDQDGDEDLWLNEGASEFAEFLNGYRPAPDSHRTTFSEFPENSLTIWGDQDGDPDQSFEVLADYQIAYWFYLYVAGRLKEADIGVENQQYLKYVSELTKNQLNGPAAFDDMFDKVGADFDFIDVWSDFRTAMLSGTTSDETEWGDYISAFDSPSGVPIAPLDLGSLREKLNFEGYDTPGAPPYGADYIEIGWSDKISEETTLDFNGDIRIPTNWTTVPASEVGVTPPDGIDNVLFSGHTDLTDNFLIFEVDVPTDTATLSFDTLYNIEAEWDFGFTQVSTDTEDATGFVSLPLSGTTSISNTGALLIIKDNVPGYSGVSGTEEALEWINVTYDMSEYAGETVLIAFRYATDSGTGGQVAEPNPGWYLANVTVGDTDLYTDGDAVPEDAQSIWQARETQNEFRLSVATFDGDNVAEVEDVELNENGNGSFDFSDLLDNENFDGAGDRVVAMVSVVPPPAGDDLISAPSGYADYTLTGLPPSLYTSRARAIGSALNSTTRTPRVYPGDNLTVMVTVDNFGRNDDLESSAAATAHVAVPIPDNTTFVAGSFESDVEPGNFQNVNDLQATFGGDLPASPGVYWTGSVSATADLSFDLAVAAPLEMDSEITPTVYIANAPFDESPSQFFTDIEEAVTVVSPLTLSGAEIESEEVPAGAEAKFVYTLLNTDDETRAVDFSYSLPEGTELVSLDVQNKPLGSDEGGAVALQQTSRIQVPSFIETEQITEVTIVLQTSTENEGDVLDPQVVLSQPDSDFIYNEVAVPGGGLIVGPPSTEPPPVDPTLRIFLPIVAR